MLICTCPVGEECYAWGTEFDCLPWCEYLAEVDQIKTEESDT